MKYFVTIWLAVVSFNCLIDATPLPEDRAKTPKEVQKINKWLGVDKNSDILKDILEVANNISSNANAIAINTGEIATIADDVEDNADNIESLITEVDTNADNIWHNQGEIIINQGDIEDNADHIDAIKAIIEIHFGGESTISPPSKIPETTTTGIEDTFGPTSDTTTVQTTTVQTTTVQTSTVVTSTVQTTTGAVDECTIDGYEPDDNGNCFKVGDKKLNWAKALKECKSHGDSVLATVPDNDANSFIKAKLSGNSWIGGNDLTKEGNWKWINGDGWGFENWKNGNDINNKNEDCAYMASNGKWQDEDCTKKMLFVCMEK